MRDNAMNGSFTAITDAYIYDLWLDCSAHPHRVTDLLCKSTVIVPGRHVDFKT